MKIPLPDKPKQTLRAAILSPFSRSHRLQREILQLEPGLAIAFRQAISSPGGRFFYVKNAKAGCQTISRYLFQLHGYLSGEPMREMGAQSTVFPEGISQWRIYQRILANPNALKFTFVRHPVKRLTSGFINFFVDETNKTRHWHWDNMLELGFRPGGDINRNFDVFLDYVALSLSYNETYCDQHWRPQWFNIGGGSVAFDFVGKLEQFDQDMATLLKLAGAEAYSEILASPKVYNRSSNGEATHVTITKAHLQKIRSLYEIDFEKFDYAP